MLVQEFLENSADRTPHKVGLICDHRVVEFCNRLPPQFKLRGLEEKWLLKQLGRKLVPADIWQRPKQPYRAPIHRSFFGENAPDYVRELLSESALREAGLFNPAAIAYPCE